VTHPFHPRHGQELEFFEYRHDWSGQRVYFYDETGCLTSMPAEWTSVAPVDELRVFGAGRARFRVDDLALLVVLVESIRASGGDERGASSGQEGVKGIMPDV
jgi:hypothetical protein